jgi:hypothetical protein
MQVMLGSSTTQVPNIKRKLKSKNMPCLWLDKVINNFREIRITGVSKVTNDEVVLFKEKVPESESINRYNSLKQELRLCGLTYTEGFDS